MAERQRAMAERQRVKQSWSLGQRKVCPQSFGHALELFGQAEVCSGAPRRPGATEQAELPTGAAAEQLQGIRRNDSGQTWSAAQRPRLFCSRLFGRRADMTRK